MAAFSFGSEIYHIRSILAMALIVLAVVYMLLSCLNKENENVEDIVIK